jgi:hypothetical protein
VAAVEVVAAEVAEAEAEEEVVVVECTVCDPVAHAGQWKVHQTTKIKNWIYQRARNPL